MLLKMIVDWAVRRRAPGVKVLYMSGYTENAIEHHGRLGTDSELL